ncbi:neuropeptide [Plakobranchus ocellatus]|uniref:Neuropeptide n=1 Tax=Plakobranchus ocellatus TaxID=259542 RepID=A0AAV3Y0I7_9GAST|nr:neuropeptide [Plakobranchus ocellatus]
MQLKLASVSRLFLLSALAGCSLAVFYTKDDPPSYPRIGRRAQIYPSLGRRSTGGAATPGINPRLLLLSGSPEAASAVTGSSSSGASSAASVFSPSFSELSKRGVFTKGKHGFPRVGRRNDGSAAMLDSGILERIAEMKAVENETGLDGEEGEVFDRAPASADIPVEIMFMVFDKDGDGNLSKDEFTSGLRKYRQQNPLC